VLNIAELPVLSSAVSFDTARLDSQKLRIRRLEHKAARSIAVPDLIAECEREDLSWPRRAARLVSRMCEIERPYIHADERIVFTRGTASIPPIYTSEQWNAKTAGRTLHELGPISNICADWGNVLSEGLRHRKRVALETRRRLVLIPVMWALDSGDVGRASERSDAGWFLQ